MSNLILQGNMLWPNGSLQPGIIEISGGQIHSVKTVKRKMNNPKIKNIPPNAIIAPGFIDIQVNGGFGHDFTTAPERMIDVAHGWPKYGVTSFLPTIITSPLENIIHAVEVGKNTLRMPHDYTHANILGLHFEGPFVNPAKGGAHNKLYMRNPVIGDESLFDPDVVRMVTLAPELPGCLEFIRKISSKGIVVGMGHTEASYEDAMKALDAGASWGTHLFNGMVELTHKKPGVVGALLTSKRLRLGIIADGIHVHPAILQLAALAKRADGITLISDAIGATGMPPGEYRLGDLKIIVDGTSSKTESGGLAGSILTLDKAVRNMVHFGACTLSDALTMASKTPAEVLGLKTKGSIAEGYDADLVILDGDLQVLSTIISGEISYTK